MLRSLIERREKQPPGEKGATQEEEQKQTRETTTTEYNKRALPMWERNRAGGEASVRIRQTRNDSKYKKS